MLKRILLAAAAACAFAGAANASIIPVLQSVTAEGDLFRYTYQATLAADAALLDGSFFVISDFAGFAGGLTASPSFTGTTENTTVFPFLLGDDAGIANLVFTWGGGGFHMGPNLGSVNFTVSALSSFGSTKQEFFAASTLTNNGGQTGTPQANMGSVDVPLAAGIPEPGAWALMILGFGGTGAMARYRRKTLTAV